MNVFFYFVTKFVYAKTADNNYVHCAELICRNTSFVNCDL